MVIYQCKLCGYWGITKRIGMTAVCQVHYATHMDFHKECGQCGVALLRNATRGTHLKHKATLPGKPCYEVNMLEALANTKYTGWRKLVAKHGGVSVRDELDLPPLASPSDLEELRDLGFGGGAGAAPAPALAPGHRMLY